MSKLPVVEVSGAQIGAQGITFGAAAVDSGGSADPGGQVIPIIRPKMFDDRAVCVQVSEFVHRGQAPDLAGCQAYKSGMCSLGGSGVKCAFHESAEHPVWDRAKDFRYVEGAGMVHRGLWDRFGIA